MKHIDTRQMENISRILKSIPLKSNFDLNSVSELTLTGKPLCFMPSSKVWKADKLDNLYKILLHRNNFSGSGFGKVESPTVKLSSVPEMNPLMLPYKKIDIDANAEPHVANLMYLAD